MPFMLGNALIMHTWLAGELDALPIWAPDRHSIRLSFTSNAFLEIKVVEVLCHVLHAAFLTCSRMHLGGCSDHLFTKMLQLVAIAVKLPWLDISNIMMKLDPCLL